MDLAPRCARHPDDRAGWRCGKCGAALCPACAAWRAVGQGAVEVCTLCGGVAPAIVARRGELAPFGLRSLGDAVRWPFHREGLLTALACAIVLWLMGKAGFLAGLFAFGVALAVCFHVTSSTARGSDELESGGDFRGFFEHVLGPLIRALLAAVWAYGPALTFLLWCHGLSLETPGPSRGETAVAALLLLAGTFLFPMALLAGAVGTPLLHLLNPLLVVGSAIKLGHDYLLIATFAVAVSLAESALLALLTALDKVVGIPGYLQDAALLLPAFMLFRALGLLLRARGDDLGYGGASAYLVPVLGARRPDTELRGPE